MSYYKQVIVSILRLLRLLGLFEKLRSYIKFIESRFLIKKFYNQSNKDFILPPFNIAYDAYSNLDPFHYQKLGKKHAQFVSCLIKKHNIKTIKSIYEWGCGPMRVLRQLPNYFPNNNIKFYGSDYNKTSVVWASKNFPNFNISLNDLNPPLPYPDNHFDVIYCISVFTHLSETVSIKYIDDIYRILKKDGIFISTFHGDMNSKVLNQKEYSLYKTGNFIERGNVLEGSRIFASYHPDLFIKKNFSKFKILEKIKCTKKNMFEQDWWVFKK